MFGVDSSTLCRGKLFTRAKTDIWDGITHTRN
jgi:hypothetical protein